MSICLLHSGDTHMGLIRVKIYSSLTFYWTKKIDDMRINFIFYHETIYPLDYFLQFKMRQFSEFSTFHIFVPLNY